MGKAVGGLHLEFSGFEAWPSPGSKSKYDNSVLVPSFNPNRAIFLIMRGLAALFLVACLIALATTILTAATASLTACILLTSIPVALR